MNKFLTYVSLSLGAILLQQPVVHASPAYAKKHTSHLNARHLLLQSMQGNTNPACSRLQATLFKKMKTELAGNAQNAKMNAHIKRLQQRCAMAKRVKVSANDPRVKNLKNFMASNSTGNWQEINNGLEGAMVFKIAIDPQQPNILYAATTGGIYKSENKAANWHLILPDAYVVNLDVAIDPKNSNNILAAGLGKIYKSTNAGQTWTTIDIASEHTVVSTVIYNPQHSNIVYATVSQEDFDGPETKDESGVFKSTNGGTTWTAVNTGSEHPDFENMLINPKNPDILYLISEQKIYKSIDAGHSWTAIVKASDYEYYNFLSMDPNHPDTLYTGLDEKILRSNDGGKSWTPLTMPVNNDEDDDSNEPFKLIVDPKDSATLYVDFLLFNNGGHDAIFKTSDAGQTWTRLSSNSFSFMLTMAFDPDSSTIYTGNYFTGIVKSDDAGKTWSMSNKGMTNTYVLDVAVDPSNKNTLYTSTVLGLYKSVDGGNSWQASFKHTLNFFNDFDNAKIIFDPNNPQILYTISDKSVLKSVDGGLHWNASETKFGGIGSIAIDPTNSSVLYAADYEGIYKSTDGGVYWSLITDPNNTFYFDKIVIDSQHSNIMYASIYWGGLMKSTDGGVNWTTLTAEDDDSLLNYVTQLALDPHDSNTLYVGTEEHGVLRSTDGGKNWGMLNDGLSEDEWINALTFDPNTKDKVYIATDHAIYLSKDAGQEWKPMNEKGLRSHHISDITVDPSNSHTLYAGTMNTGVYKLAP